VRKEDRVVLRGRGGRVLRTVGAVVLGLGGLGLWLVWDSALFWTWKQEAGPLPFFMALAVLPLVGFPTTPFYILAGATFGVTTGIGGSALSLGVNLVCCHWIARSGLRPFLERLLRRTPYTLPQIRTRRALGFTLAVKLLPGVPAFIKNYLIALSGVSFFIYFGVGFSISMAYAAAFVVLGESILEKDWTMLGLMAGLLGILIVVFWLLRRRLQ